MNGILEYRGWFKLEQAPGPVNFGYGCDAMCLGPEGSLYISGRRKYGLVAQVMPPETMAVGVTRAPIIRGFFDPTPGDELDARQKKLVLDRLGDVAYLNGRLYSAHYTYYGVQGTVAIDRPTLMAINPVTGVPVWDDFRHIGPWSDGAPPWTQKFTSKYMCLAPGRFLDQLGENLLLCGRGDGAGNANGPRFPSIVAVDPLNPEIGIPLIWRDMKTDPNPPVEQWDPDDQWKSCAWVEETLLIIGRKAVNPSWYGGRTGPDGRYDSYRAGRGPHTDKRVVEVRVFPAERLRMVVNGAVKPTQIVPYLTFTLPQFHEASAVRGAAYDPERKRLYVAEHWPIEHEGNTYPGEDPRIHVYKTGEVTPPKPPEVENRSVQISIQGVGSFRGMGVFESEG